MTDKFDKDRLEQWRKNTLHNESAERLKSLSTSAGSVVIGDVGFEVCDGELLIDHLKCHWSDIYTIPLEEVPTLIEYLQGISQNERNNHD